MEWAGAKHEVKSFSHETEDNIPFFAELANRKWEWGLRATTGLKPHAYHKSASCTESIRRCCDTSLISPVYRTAVRL